MNIVVKYKLIIQNVCILSFNCIICQFYILSVNKKIQANLTHHKNMVHTHTGCTDLICMLAYKLKIPHLPPQHNIYCYSTGFHNLSHPPTLNRNKNKINSLVLEIVPLGPNFQVQLLAPVSALQKIKCGDTGLTRISSSGNFFSHQILDRVVILSFFLIFFTQG